MDFISNQKEQNQEMLSFLGVKTVEELFGAIPSILKINPIQSDDGLSEYEGMRLMESIAAKNSFQCFDNYLGAGAYEHHIPAIVSMICSKSEFLTSYTPYQPEVSQGMLQAIFEFQSAICALTGMDVSNASLYDGASACAEGLLMALRCQKDRRKVLVSNSMHPHYRSVVAQYLCHPEISIQFVPFTANGSTDFEALDKSLDEQTAAILVQYPNFFGSIEEVKVISNKAKQAGALTVVSANPLVYGLFANAKESGADIAVGDCQPFGLPLAFGGPYAGYIACRQDLIRQLPGRIVGETADTQGRRGFVLTLQAREQHIRREKATSNICTNQALAALASLVAMLWYGKEGIKKLALTNYQRACYLQKRMSELTLLSPFANLPFFNEFVIKCNMPAEQVQEHFRRYGIEPGLALGRFFPELSDCLLVAVTETKNKDQLDHYVATMRTLPPR